MSTDTRKIIPNSIFFALKGENFNANEFALQALEKGANYAVVDEKKYSTHDRAILVPNVLETLQQLAKHHRDQLTIPVIGLTGSNGKTTIILSINRLMMYIPIPVPEMEASFVKRWNMANSFPSN